MKIVLRFLWIFFLFVFLVHGVYLIKKEWQTRFIHTHGQLVEVTIEKLACAKHYMSVRFESLLFDKEIDVRNCISFNSGQKIKLKHSREYPDAFLFVNEHHSNWFVIGGLEILLSLIGVMASLPASNRRATREIAKNFKQSLN